MEQLPRVNQTQTVLAITEVLHLFNCQKAEKKVSFIAAIERS
ncbi:hypothetical protein SynBIOSE41_02496 [Synechococcus sp. BIOS-E4-1]|nr:hypothetical protein SynBIOSE41_02496 [Synechococcus sp. BIOS-E4-1]